MTLDDLVKIANNAVRTGGISLEFSDRIIVRAVVRALRDEAYKSKWSTFEIDRFFEEILGSDAGNEKAAGGPTPDNGRPLVEGADKETSQAAAPAADPKVCVWTPHHRTEVGVKMKGTCGIISWRDFVNCPSCGKPIKFQEKNNAQ